MGYLEERISLMKKELDCDPEAIEESEELLADSLPVDGGLRLSPPKPFSTNSILIEREIW